MRSEKIKSIPLELPYMVVHISSHTHTLALLQYSLMHPKQKLWPQGVDDGLVNRSRQMEHWNCSSDNKLPGKDILWENEQIRT